MEEKKKRGRPVKESSKTCRVEFRLTEEELNTLDYLADKRSMTRTDIFNEAMRVLSNIDRYVD